MDCKDFFSRWRSWIRPLVIAFYVILLVIALPLLIVEFQVQDTQTHIQAWFIGGLFTLMAIPISLWGILQHLVHFTQPILQKNIVRILWMVPIYAVDAWLALRFKDVTIYLDTLRECYEAYVIYSFMSYLLNFLHSEFSDLEGHVTQKPQTKHLIPFCWLPKWAMGRDFIQHCKHGVLQYTVIRPITTCIALITELAGVYGEGHFKFNNSWVYLAIIDNFSQIWAMYCLILFYQAMKEELKPLRPIAKFACVKAVVFLSFWQQVVIALLVAVGVIRQDNTWGDYNTEDVATGLQDFIICVEMFFAAVAHYYSFSHKPYIDPTAEQNDCCRSFLDMWDISDVRQDVAEHVQHVRSTVTRPLKRNIATGHIETERTPLLSGGGSSVEVITYPAAEASNHLQVSSDYEASVHRLAADRESVSSVGSYSGADQTSRRSFNASMNNFVADFTDSGSAAQAKEPVTDKRSVSAGHMEEKDHEDEVLIDFSVDATVETTVPHSSSDGQSNTNHQSSNTPDVLLNSTLEPTAAESTTAQSPVQKPDGGDKTTP